MGMAAAATTAAEQTVSVSSEMERAGDAAAHLTGAPLRDERGDERQRRCKREVE
jgi:hypothetical protein